MWKNNVKMLPISKALTNLEGPKICLRCPTQQKWCTFSQLSTVKYLVDIIFGGHLKHIFGPCYFIRSLVLATNLWTMSIRTLSPLTLRTKMAGWKLISAPSFWQLVCHSKSPFFNFLTPSIMSFLFFQTQKTYYFYWWREILLKGRCSSFVAALVVAWREIF